MLSILFIVICVLSSFSLSILSPPKLSVYLLKSNGKSKIIHEPSSQNNGNVTLGEWDGPIESNPSRFRYRMDCIANYPVRIVYSGYGGPQGSLRNYREIKNSLYHFQDSSKYKFSSKFYFNMIERNTGNYTCVRSSNENGTFPSTSLHIFVAGSHGFVLDSVAALMDAGIPKMNFESKQINNFSLEEIIENDKFINHSSSIGFPNYREYLYDNNVKLHIRIPVADKDIWANIPCSVTNRKSNVLLYKIDASNNWKFLRSNNTFLKYDPRKGYDLKLRMFKDIFNSSFLCAIDNIKTMLNVTFIRDSITEEINIEISEKEAICHTNSPHVRFGLTPCFSVSDCEFSMALLQNTFFPNQFNQGTNMFKLKLENNPVALLPGILHCSTRIGNIQSMYLFHGKFYKDLSTFQEFEFENSIDLIEYFDDEYKYLNTTSKNNSFSNRTFLCSASAFIYAESFVFILRTVSGASYNMLGFGSLIKSNDETPEDEMLKSYVVVIEKLLDPIQSLTCYVPLLNSRTKWINLTFYPNLKDLSSYSSPELIKPFGNHFETLDPIISSNQNRIHGYDFFRKIYILFIFLII